MLFDKCLALVFSLMILGQAYLVRRYVGTWLFPACLFGLFWFGFTFFPLAILFWVPLNPYAIGFILLCALAFSFGSLFFDWKMAFRRNAEKRETAALVYDSRLLKIVFYLSAVGSLVFLLLDWVGQGFSVHELFFDLVRSAGVYRAMATSDDMDVTMFDRWALVFAYLATILGGFLFCVAPTKFRRRTVVVMSFLPATFVMLMQSSKGLLFLCIAFFYGSVLAYRTSIGELRLLNRGTIKSVAIYGAVLMPIVTISFVARGLYDLVDRSDVVRRLIWYYASYAFGHLYAFADWFTFATTGQAELTYFSESATHGFYTFMALFRLMGSQKYLPPGLYDEYYSYGDLLTSNIYTVFRGLVTDFGFIGTVLFMFAAGLLVHKTFHAMLLKRKPVLTVAIFVLMIGCFYTSFLVSLLIWKSIYVTFVLLWMVLQVNKGISQTAGHRLAPQVGVSQHAQLPGS